MKKVEASYHEVKRPLGNKKKKIKKNPERAPATAEALLQGERKQSHPVIYKRITGETVKIAAIETKEQHDLLVWMKTYGGNYLHQEKIHHRQVT